MASLSHAVAATVLTPPPADTPPRIVGTSGIDTTGLPTAPGANLPFNATTLGSFDATTLGAPAATADAQWGATRVSAPPARTTEPPARPTIAPPDSEETGPLKPGKPFGTRYHIIRMLGLGGMGAVYQAWDEELGVAVAIKVIRPEAMEDRAAALEIERRFKRELLLAREVTHKNVVRIHDLGEISGIKYITMSYIDGSDLATIIKREGRLPVPKALLILRSVIPGLVAAHAAGVVHRDLKPANIMIGKKGDALIMDFGIARSIGGPDLGVDATPADLPEEFRLAAERTLAAGATMAGSIVGTVHYMAPEQARGQDVDQRADIYAMGLIVYDMLLGRRRAEQADSAVGELEARMKQAPPSVRSVAPEIPLAVDALVSRCLDPDQAKRFQTTADFVAALDRLDENGEPLPIRRVVGLPLMAAVVVVLVGLGGGLWYYQRQFIPPPVHDPVSVVIADFQNGTGDATFEHTLEPMLKLTLEGAGFISAYGRTEIARTLGVRPPEALTESAAREIAVKQGLGVVLSGAITRRGNGYDLSVKAVQAVTGQVLATANARAAGREQVLAAATGLGNDVREALGDDTSESDKLFALDTLSATSLDVVRDYAAAMDALSNSRFEEARLGFSRAVALDPKFGLGYAGLAVASRNLDKQQDAQNYIKEAVRHLDGMTERERYRTRGLAFEWTNDYQACVKEFGELLARYANDAMARNNRALCLTYLRDLPKAMDEMRQVIKILPKRSLYRENLALYSAYSSDAQAAEREAAAIEQPGLFGVLPLAFAHVLQGRLPEATETYQSLAKIDKQGASYTASGLGDLALYEGRFSDAARIFAAGAATDLSTKDTDRAASKFAALAYTQVLRQQRAAAIAAAEKALENSSAVKIRFLAARVFVEAGAAARAQALAADLGNELQAEPQAYAKIIEGESALKNRDARQAIKVLTEANTLLDTWMGHFDLGRAYLAAEAFTQADAEFDRCLKRRGEAIALFLDEEPTYGMFPPVYYFQGRVREGLGSAGFADAYRTYTSIRGQSKEDSLLPDVRRRAGL